jgi:hypothetical protein
MELLDDWSKQGHVDSELWAHMIRFLTLSFEVDEGGEQGKKPSFKANWKLTIRQHSGGMISFASYRNH